MNSWASTPAGIRNNNPGNLVSTSINWQGEVRCADKRHECFKTPYWGIRALLKTLDTYRYRYKLYTIRTIMYRYTPVNHNAADAVSSIAGIRKDDILDWSNPYVIFAVTHAIIRLENGYNPYVKELQYAIKKLYRNTRRVEDRRLSAVLGQQFHIQHHQAGNTIKVVTRRNGSTNGRVRLPSIVGKHNPQQRNRSRDGTDSEGRSYCSTIRTDQEI